jgi:predicted secreted protein
MPRSLAARLCQPLLLGSLSGLLACGVLPLRGGIAAAVAAEWEPELAPGHTLSLSSQDNGRTINLRRGEQLRLVMGGNAGTGYRWVINTIDRRQLQLVGAELWSDPGPLIGPGRRPGLVGGPQQTTFLFRVIGNGASDLQLKYWPGVARASAGDPSFRVRVESGSP